MTRQAIIDRTLNVINLLPVDKVEEISDFADFIAKRYEEQILTGGLQTLIAKSETFKFLESEEDLYSTADLKEIYNG